MMRAFIRMRHPAMWTALPFPVVLHCEKPGIAKMRPRERHAAGGRPTGVGVGNDDEDAVRAQTVRQAGLWREVRHGGDADGDADEGDCANQNRWRLLVRF